jgi:hypothetical protein
MKEIKIKSCKECPYLGEYGLNSHLCTVKQIQILNIDEIHKDCKLNDYPKTVTEFLGGRI